MTFSPRHILFASVYLTVLLVWAGSAAANATTVVKPNGGECLTVGQDYTIEFSWSGADVKHVALYYRTDGQQPTHLDSSVIKHPINVPQQGTTWDWKPASADISETGRVWVDGHEAGHASLSTWDSSNADFAVRSSCAAAPAAGAGFRKAPTTPPPPAGFDKPAGVVEVLPSTTTARLRFEVPWEENRYRVRLIRDEDILDVTLTQQELTVGPGGIIEFHLAELAPNTYHPFSYYIQAYAPFTGFESVPSKHTDPFWTKVEDPVNLTLQVATKTSATIALAAPVPNLGLGLTAVWFEELTTATSSGWRASPVWDLVGLMPDTQYQVWAKLRNSVGVETASTTPLTFRTPSAPPAVAAPSEDEVRSQLELESLRREIEVFARILQEAKQLIAARFRAIPPSPPSAAELLPPEPPAPPPPPPPPAPPAPSQVEGPPPLPAPTLRRPQTFLVTFDERGFQPQVLEIEVGDSVRWINRSATPVWPASDPHPTHTGLSGFDALGQVFSQETYRITFTRPGEFSYHNHVQAQAGAEHVWTGLIRVPSPPAPPPPEPGPPALQPRVLPQPAPTPTPAPRALQRPPPAPPPPSPPAGGAPAPTPTPPAPPPELEARPVQPPKTYVVVFAAGGFNPQTLEIRAGDTVRWVNHTPQPVWPASDPHPTHTGLPGFDALGDLLRSESYRHTFRTPGTWAYHNHTVARAEFEPEVGVIFVSP